MGEAARALDDVSDHLGEVLRRADALLAEWSRFGAEVHAQVDREVAAIGDVVGNVVDGAVARAASEGLDRAITDRLRALTAELERLEQRTRAAARAAAERRDGDRRVLWIVVAGIALANALLVALLLRRPDAVPVAEPVRIEAPATEPVRIEAPATARTPPTGAAPGNAPGPGAADTSSAPAAGSAAEAPEAGPPAPGTGSKAQRAGVTAGSNASDTGASAGSNAAAKPGAHAALHAPPPSPGSAAKPPAEAAGARPAASPNSPSPKGGTPRPHKKLP